MILYIFIGLLCWFLIGFVSAVLIYKFDIADFHSFYISKKQKEETLVYVIFFGIISFLGILSHTLFNIAGSGIIIRAVEFFSRESKKEFKDN
jgi:hypothetical protein